MARAQTLKRLHRSRAIHVRIYRIDTPRKFQYVQFSFRRRILEVAILSILKVADAFNKHQYFKMPRARVRFYLYCGDIGIG